MNAIVTGATKGIGRALVMHLAANNYNVALCARNGAEVQTFIDELKASFPGQSFYGMAADLEKGTDLNALADFLLVKMEDIDVLINNAGLYIPADLMHEDESALERQMKVNVYAPHFLSRTVARRMSRAGKGHIFNICSIASIRPVAGAASYSISKAALLSLTRLLREELLKSGISVTAILPGSTLTDSWSGSDIPAGRLVDPDDIAKAVITCLSMSPGANVDEIIVRPLRGEL